MLNIMDGNTLKAKTSAHHAKRRREKVLKPQEEQLAYFIKRYKYSGDPIGILAGLAESLKAERDNIQAAYEDLLDVSSIAKERDEHLID